MLDEKDLQMIEQLLDRQAAKFDEKLESLSGRVDEKLESLSGRVDEKLESLSGRVDEKLEQQTVMVKLLLETEVSRKINAVYEKLDGMEEKMDQLTPKSRVDALEDEMAFLKSVVRAHSVEIAELKKAQ